MSRTWLISDTHFGHANILTFEPPRPFKDISEHDQTLIENWNSVVKPDDKIYHLGDVGLKNATYLGRILSCLNGSKVLIKGNHDTLKLSQYQQFFKDVRAYHVLDKILLAHIPIHPHSLGRWRGQVHGHTHFNCVTETSGPFSKQDKRYMNISVEQIKYTPIAFEEVQEYYEKLRTSN
jgi:calcineurin-like phosphoesterase family protein